MSKKARLKKLEALLSSETKGDESHAEMVDVGKQFIGMYKDIANYMGFNLTEIDTPIEAYRFVTENEIEFLLTKYWLVAERLSGQVHMKEYRNYWEQKIDDYYKAHGIDINEHLDFEGFKAFLIKAN